MIQRFPAQSDIEVYLAGIGRTLNKCKFVAYLIIVPGFNYHDKDVCRCLPILVVPHYTKIIIVDDDDDDDGNILKLDQNMAIGGAEIDQYLKELNLHGEDHSMQQIHFSVDSCIFSAYEETICTFSNLFDENVQFKIKKEVGIVLESCLKQPFIYHTCFDHTKVYALSAMKRFLIDNDSLNLIKSEDLI